MVVGVPLWYNAYMLYPGIYIHIDPNTLEVRYIGASSSWKKRAYEHFRPNRCTAEGNTHHKRWINQLKRHGQLPIVQCLQSFPSNIDRHQLYAAEVYWIEYFRSLGCPLTNATVGGEGHIQESETRQKISAALLKHWNKPPKPLKMPLTTALRISKQTQSRPIIDNDGITYMSIKEAARTTGFAVQKIQDVLHDRRPHWHGKTFKFVT